MNIKKIKNRLVELQAAHYYKLLERELESCKSVLDVGCGSSSPLAKLKKSYYLEGIDIFGPDLKILQLMKVHDKYTVGNVLNLEKIYKNKKFDAVIALDLIEHLTKKDGFKLLKDMEKIATKKVIIVTPNGFVPQKANDNPYQEHISGWEVKEFKDRGYKIYGMRGLKYLLGENASLKYRPWLFFGGISAISQLFTYYFPSFSFELMAVLHKENS